MFSMLDHIHMLWGLGSKSSTSFESAFLAIHLKQKPPKISSHSNIEYHIIFISDKMCEFYDTHHSC